MHEITIGVDVDDGEGLKVANKFLKKWSRESNKPLRKGDRCILNYSIVIELVEEQRFKDFMEVAEKNNIYYYDIDNLNLLEQTLKNSLNRIEKIKEMKDTTKED